MTPDGYSWKDRVLKTEEIANGVLESPRNRNETVSLAKLLEEADRRKEEIEKSDQAQAQAQGQDSSKAQSIDTDDEGHSFSV